MPSRWAFAFSTLVPSDKATNSSTVWFGAPALRAAIAPVAIVILAAGFAAVFTFGA